MDYVKLINPKKTVYSKDDRHGKTVRYFAAQPIFNLSGVAGSVSDGRDRLDIHPGLATGRPGQHRLVQPKNTLPGLRKAGESD